MIRKNKTRLLIILVFVLLIFLIIYLDNRVWDDNKSFALKKDLKVTVYSNKKSRSIDVPRLLCEIAGIKNA